MVTLEWKKNRLNITFSSNTSPRAIIIFKPVIAPYVPGTIQGATQGTCVQDRFMELIVWSKR